MTVQYVKRNKYEQMRRDAIERILNAAAESFSSEGYAATTMQKIAHRAGLVPSAIYHYFSNKEDILDAVLGRETQALNAALQSGLQNHMTDRGIDGFLDYMRDCVYSHRDRISLLCQLTQLHCLPADAVEKLDLLYLFDDTVTNHPLTPENRQKLNAILPDFIAFTVLYTITGHRDTFERQISALKQRAPAFSP